VLPGGACADGNQECYLIAGLLQEFTTWADGGRFYRIMETECRGNGSQACLYRIEKKPLD
jgi:predicted hydrocarbon binding protein